MDEVKVKLSSFDRSLVAANTAASIYTAVQTKKLAEETAALRQAHEAQLAEMRAEKNAAELVHQVFQWVEQSRDFPYPSAEARAYDTEDRLGLLNSVDSSNLVEQAAKDRYASTKQELEAWMARADPEKLALLKWALHHADQEYHGLVNTAAHLRVLASARKGELFPNRYLECTLNYLVLAGLGAAIFHWQLIQYVPEELAAWVLPALLVLVPSTLWLMRAAGARRPAEWSARRTEVRKAIPGVVSYCCQDLADPADLEREANRKVDAINFVKRNLLGQAGQWDHIPVGDSLVEPLLEVTRLARAHRRSLWMARGFGVVALGCLLATGHQLGDHVRSLASRVTRQAQGSQQDYLRHRAELLTFRLTGHAARLDTARESYLLETAQSLGLIDPASAPARGLSDPVQRSEWLLRLITEAAPGKAAAAIAQLATEGAKIDQWPLAAIANAPQYARELRAPVDQLIKQLQPYLDTRDLQQALTNLDERLYRRITLACEAAGMSPREIADASGRSATRSMDLLAALAQRSAKALKEADATAARLAVEAKRAADVKARQDKVAEAKEQKHLEQVRRDFAEAWIFLKLTQAWGNAADATITPAYNTLLAQCTAAGLATALGMNDRQFTPFFREAARVSVASTGKATIGAAYVTRLQKATIGDESAKIAFARGADGLPGNAAGLVDQLNSNLAGIDQLLAKARDLYHPDGYAALMTKLQSHLASFLKSVRKDRPDLAPAGVAGFVVSTARDWSEVKKLGAAYAQRFSLEETVKQAMAGGQ